MVEATLIAAKGARHVSREELSGIQSPAPTRTHYPIQHAAVAEACEQTLQDAGYGIKSADYAVSQGNQQMFCTYTLTAGIADGTCVLAVGLRSSYNKTLPLGLVAGTRVMVCSNLSFRADLINVRRLHTKFASDRFTHDIAGAVSKLNSFRETEEKRVSYLREMPLTEDQADALILRASVDRRIVPARLLPKLVHEWRDPTHEDFKPRTAWSLFNAVTTVLGDHHDRNPNEHALRTMRLNRLLLANEPSFAVSA